MRKLNVSSNVIALFFNSTISSVINYANTAFYDLLSNHLQEDLNRPRKICKKLLDDSHDEPVQNSVVYKDKVIKMADKIMKDPNHPLHTEYEYLPSGRRLRVPRSRTNRFKHSFVPRSIHLLNQ